MLRKLNFTERTKVPRAAVNITLRREPDGVLAFDALLNLGSLSFPAASRVYIEAHYRTSYMRFDCGLPVKLREFGILVTARYWDAQYSWNAHVDKARAAGIPQSVIDDLAAKRTP